MKHEPEMGAEMRMSPVISFSPDVKRLITISNKGATIAWDVATGKAASKFDFQGYC